MAAAAVLGDVRHAFNTGGELFSSQRFRVGAGHPFAGASVAAIRERHGALVIGVRRAGAAAALPPLDAVIAAGDEVAVLAPLAALSRLRAL
jgi:cell volume regulation protein A